jgi:hypothetical protein
MPGMATHRAIAGIGKSIVGLLAEQCPKSEFPGATFKLGQSFELPQSKPLRFGITLCLYRVNVNATQLNSPNRPTLSEVRRQRSPLPLDLHFLLTSWAKTAERQQELLGWAMCVLGENPLLPAGLLNRFTGGSGAVFGSQENVEIIPENLDTELMKAVCELVQVQQQPSVAYLARSVAVQIPGA